MKVFLSWSGERSHRVAQLFNDWLPQVLQNCKPWLSSTDIESGSVWDSEIQQSLDSTNFGIVFLTLENKEKPWILFEAGSLSKGLNESRVCTILIDLQPEDLIKNPLSKFNHSFPFKESLMKLMHNLNSHLGEVYHRKF